MTIELANKKKDTKKIAVRVIAIVLAALFVLGGIAAILPY